MDLSAVAAAARRPAARPTPGAADLAAYLPAQVSDASHREVVGPLLDGGGASGVVLHRGQRIAAWGDPSRPEMAFSATKSVVALVAGVAFDRGLLTLGQRVTDTVELPALDPARDLVVVSRWGEDVTSLLVDVSAALPVVDARASRESLREQS